MLIRATLALSLLALAACGASGAPEKQIDLDPPEDTVAVVGEI